MAEKSREQWLRAIRRWLLTGLVLGFAFGVFAHFAWDRAAGLIGLLESVAFYVPMGAALIVMLWASMYRYDFHKVWGLSAMWLTIGLLLLMMTTSIGIGCLQGICGER